MYNLGNININPTLNAGNVSTSFMKGEQGYSISRVARTEGTGEPGTTDIYTVYINTDPETAVGTFSVYNGAGGDMFKSIYDTDNDGIVDKATADADGNDITTTYETITNVTALANRVTTIEGAGYITKSVSDLANYYLKTETYTKAEVNTLCDLIPKFAIEVVDSLPTQDISTTTIYLVRDDSQTGDIYQEYIYVNNTWELLGAQRIDLSNFYTKSETYSQQEVNTLLANKLSQINNPTYTTTEGTDLSIDNTRVGKMKFEYYGDTEQFTTTGINFFSPYDTTTQTLNGVKRTTNADGSITLIGTATADSYFRVTNDITLESNTAYTTLNQNSNTPNGVTIYYNNLGNIGLTYTDTVILPNGRVKAYTTGSVTGTISIAILVQSGVTVNATLYPMLVKGTITTSNIPNYEPYTGGIALPNPDYPQEVKTVTGENTIDLFGTNIYSTYLENGGISGGTGQNEDLSGRIRSHDYISLLEKTYTISCKETGFYTYVYCYGENKNYLGVVGSGWNSLPYTFTPKNNTKFIRFTVKKANDGAISPSEVTEVQINLGSTVLPYTQYQGSQSYELNLGANLFNIQKFWKENKIGATNGLRYVLEQNNAVYITGTPTNYSGCYGRAFSETEVFMTAKANHTYRILIKLSNKVSNIETRFYIGTTSHNDWNILGMTSNGIYIKDYTPTSDINFTQFSVIGAGASNTTPITAVMEIAIYDITNVSITNYQPYFEPIQLCDIEEHQDYIYNNGGKWYLRKENGKVDLATLSWTTQIYLDDGYKLFFATINDIKYASNSTTLIDNYSEKYIKSIASGMSQTNKRNHLAIDTDAIRVNATDYPTGLFYYPLATPTDTEITNTALINQLNAIKYGAESYYGQTNIMIISEELQPILKVQTLDKIGD